MLITGYIRKGILIFAIVLTISFGWDSIVFGFAGNTHKAITKETIDRSVLAGDYLDKQLGFTSKLTTELELLEQFQNNINTRVLEEPGYEWAKTKASILEWLQDGGELEDVPNPRARHHFYDPIRNTGLNNSERPWWIIDPLKYFSKTRYPNYWEFDATGGSSFDRAIHNTGIWENEYVNCYYWGYARSLFYDALKASSKTERENTFGSIFFILGHICHLLEDQGVPAHARNDFIWAHLLGGYYDKDTPLKDGGNAFEIWVENQVKSDGNTIPTQWLTGAGSNIPAFSKLKKYWDTNSYSGQYVGETTPDTWGLCEKTNYQFLSFSTIFKNDGSLYVFPNPSKENAPVASEFVNGIKRYYRSGYDVPHLARVSYTTYTSGIAGITTTYEEDTVEEANVFTDYAQKTIPRTINYAIGFVNYFFRGRLSAEANCIECNVIELTITNQSVNSGVQQTLKGGAFELYWDDNDGNRAEVVDFGVDGWGPASTLAYNASIKATFIKPEGTPAKYVVVYKGNICENPADPDPDDENAIAVTTIAPLDDCCGACCDKATGSCSQTIQAECSYTWRGPGSTCENDCRVGACCDEATGNCSQTTQDGCSYHWLGEGSSCDDCEVEPPEHINVTFNGIANCDCLYCDYGFGIWESWVFEGYAECINGTHQLTQDSPSSWSAYYDCGEFYPAELWWALIGGEPCDKEALIDFCQLFKIYVKIVGTEVIVGVQCSSCDYMDYFYGSFPVGDGNSIAGQCSNTVSCGSNYCGTVPDWYVPTEGGTAIVWY